MSLLDLSKLPKMECPDFQPMMEGKRCGRYRSSDRGCRHEDHPICEIWLHANPKAKLSIRLSAMYLQPYRRHVTEGAYFGSGWRERIRWSLGLDGPQAKPSESVAPSAPVGLAELSADRLESFKALNVAVCFAAPGRDEVWLVPVYTPPPSSTSTDEQRAVYGRTEISVDDAATLVRILAAFPGARIDKFIKLPKTKS